MIDINLYHVAAMVFAAVFLGSLAVYLLLRLKFSRSGARVAKRLHNIGAGNVAADGVDFSILKDERLSNIPTLNRILVKITLAGKINATIQQAGLDLNAGTFILTTLVFAGGAFLIVFHLGYGVIPAAVVGLVAGLLPWVYVLYKRRKRINRFEEQLPEALDLISNALKSGFSFEAALRMVGEEMPDPIGTEFGITFEEQNLGVRLADSLAGLRERVPSDDLDLFLMALVIHKKTGGHLAEVLGNAAATVRDRFRLQREVRTKTIHSRFSGVILIFLPVVAIGAMLLLNTDYIMILLKQKLGHYLLGAAFLMQLTGILVIRRIIDIRL